MKKYILLVILGASFLCCPAFGNPADFDANGFVDFNDFSIFADAWQSSTGGPNWNAACDIAPPGGDGFVGINDLDVFSAYWLQESIISGTLEFDPTDDSYANHNLPDDNYGSANYLAVRSDATGKGRNTFLKFTVSDVTETVVAAKLKLYSTDVTMNVDAKAVSNTSWTEGAITWNNQPAAGATLDTKSPGMAMWVEFDVTSHVTANGTYSFCLQGDYSTSGQTFNSKEGANKPVLIVTYGDANDATPPAAPTGLGATAGNAQVLLDWDDNTEPDVNYSVYRDTSTGGPYTEIASGVTVSNYTDTGVSNATTYYYVVTAVGIFDNESADSNEVSATPLSTIPPAAPTGLAATAGDTQVELDWDDNTEVSLASYSVYRDTTSGGPYTKIASGIPTSDYNDTGLTNGTTYYYVVTAVDINDNESGNSIEVSATPQVYQYARPISDKSNVGNWTTTPLYAKVDEVTRNDGDYILSPLVTNPDLSYVCKLNLSPVSDPGEYSGDENHVFSYAFRTAIPPATQAGPQKFVFQLYQGGTKIASYDEHKCGAQTEWTQRDRKLLPDEVALITDYSALYVVIKVNAQGTTGENGACSWVQLKIPPAKKTIATAPSGLAATVISDKQINLSWTDNSSNEDGFFIERKLTTGGTWERLYPVTAPDVTSYSARVAPSTDYSFRVCAYNTGGDSSYTSTATGTSSSHTATNYYVATDGNDNDAGTIGAPFATIQKGVDMLSAGDTLYIRGGTYQEEIKLLCLTGTDVNRITITNYNDEEVILDGTEEITSSWEVHSGNIYKTTLSEDIWQLFVDGRMMTPARWPNADNPMDAGSNHWDKYATWGQMNDSQSTADKMYHMGSPTLSGTGKSFQGGIAILNTGGWTTFAEEIISHTAGNNYFTHTYTDNFGRFPSDAHYYIECDLDCLDAAEEWFYDRSTKVLYLYAAGGVDPDTLSNIRGKRQNYAMELDYCEYLTIKGLKFYGNTLCSDEGRRLIIDGCTFSYPSFRPTMLGIEYISDHEESEWYCYPYFDGQTVIWNTSGAVTQNVVKNCTFEYTDGAGLDMTKGKEDIIE
ncbi:MAG: CBM96 family carbohydrate-binding protein, partial [Planctomycetota bacterium]